MLLPVNQLIDIISSDELNVRSEEQVYTAVMAWVKSNMAERRQNLPQVCHWKRVVYYELALYRVFFFDKQHSDSYNFTGTTTCETASAESKIPGWDRQLRVINPIR